jgi:Phage integrase family
MALRNILITLLMHGAGLRCSECFHLWVDDVRQDPSDPTRALVRVGHPSEGLAEWRDAAGKIVNGTRLEYLGTRGLTPRHLIRGKEHAGWKGARLDGKYYIQAHWSDASYAQCFLRLWKEYLTLILPIERRHPWAFIQRDGAVYKMASFHQDYNNAVKAIGLKPRRSNGTQPHCHRHAYGQRLAEAGISASVIQKTMHHASPESQRVYTEADRHRMQSELNAAKDKMAGLVMENISQVLKLEDAS